MILDYYIGTPGKTAPTIEILNAKGKVIRHIRPPMRPAAAAAAADVPSFFGGGGGGGTTNESGINRVVWNFREDGVTQWTGNPALPPGAAAFAVPLGVPVLPGTYSARMTLGGKTYTQSFEVKKDPLSPISQADYAAAYNFAKKYLGISGKINTVLNNLDAQKKSLTEAQAALEKSGNTALLARVTDAMTARDAIFRTFTANYKNGEDSLQWPGALREDLPVGGGAASLPTPARLEYARRYDREYAAAMARYNAFVTGTLVPLADALKAAGAGTIAGAAQVH